MKIRAKKAKHKNVEDGYYRAVRLDNFKFYPFYFSIHFIFTMNLNY